MLKLRVSTENAVIRHP